MSPAAASVFSSLLPCLPPSLPHLISLPHNHIALCAAGPSVCYLLPVIIRDSKTASNGELGYSGSIRNRDPVMCSHGSLAFFLILKFTILLHAWPSLKPEDSYGWNNYYLYGGAHSCRARQASSHWTYPGQWRMQQKSSEVLHVASLPLCCSISDRQVGPPCNKRTTSAVLLNFHVGSSQAVAWICLLLRLNESFLCWCCNTGKAKLTYTQMYKSLKHVMHTVLGFLCNKVTHAFRGLSAKVLDLRGIKGQVSC